MSAPSMPLPPWIGPITSSGPLMTLPLTARPLALLSSCLLYTSHFDKMDATQADAILDFEVKDATTTYGRISFSVRDADNNNFLYFETRDVVVIENDVTRIVSHFLQVVEDAKKAAHRKEAPEKS